MASFLRAFIVLCLLPLGIAGFSLPKWPTATSSQTVSKTIKVAAGSCVDYKNKRLNADSSKLGNGDQSEHQKPILELANGACVKNVIIGKPGADGIHCQGSCTLESVWWEDVGEDAATFRSKSASTKYTVDGGGAKSASDKVFQFNGAGTLTIKNFQVHTFGKLVRSCGNCKTQYQRKIVVDRVKATGKGLLIAGINKNYKDSATISNVEVSSKVEAICGIYEGNDSEKEPPELSSYAAGTKGDGTYCIMSNVKVSS